MSCTLVLFIYFKEFFCSAYSSFPLIIKNLFFLHVIFPFLFPYICLDVLIRLDVIYSIFIYYRFFYFLNYFFHWILFFYTGYFFWSIPLCKNNNLTSYNFGCSFYPDFSLCCSSNFMFPSRNIFKV
jgi:hypothetical protein